MILPSSSIIFSSVILPIISLHLLPPARPRLLFFFTRVLLFPWLQQKFHVAFDCRPLTACMSCGGLDFQSLLMSRYSSTPLFFQTLGFSIMRVVKEDRHEDLREAQVRELVDSEDLIPLGLLTGSEHQGPSGLL